MGPGGLFGRGAGQRRRGGARMKRGDVRTAALLLIAEQPMNGYQIIQTLGERTGGVWRPSSGAVYPALSQLEDEGLIEAIEIDGRKAYQLTDAGQEQAQAAQERPRPWDFAEDRACGNTWTAGAGTVWAAVGQLAMAAHAVVQGGQPEQVTRAAELIDDTRRQLYRVLAEEAPEKPAAADAEPAVLETGTPAPDDGTSPGANAEPEKTNG